MFSFGPIDRGQSAIVPLRLAALTIVLLFAGCGEAEGPTAVTGTVTIGGKQAAGGVNDIMVTFIGDKNQECTGRVNSGGRYRIDNPPLGEVKIIVREVTTGKRPEVPNTPKRPTLTRSDPVPKKYEKVENGLTYIVRKGPQTYNIELTP